MMQLRVHLHLHVISHGSIHVYMYACAGKEILYIVWSPLKTVVCTNMEVSQSTLDVPFHMLADR